MPRFQFSLRSLLIFTLFVAVLCSLGVYTHWIVSVVVGIGGFAGRITAKEAFGFIQGGIYGSAFAFVALILAGLLFRFALFLGMGDVVSIAMAIAVVIGGTIFGGIYGGLNVREPPRK